MNITIQISENFVLHIEGSVATHNVAPVLKIIFLCLCLVLSMLPPRLQL